MIIAFLKGMVVRLKNRERFIALGKVFRPSYQTAETIFDTLFIAIVVKPVLGLHVGKKALKFFGKQWQLRFQFCISALGEGFQLYGFENRFVVGQEMVVNDVHKCPTVQSVNRSEKCFCFLRCGMFIGESVDGPVKHDTVANVRGIVVFFFALHKIADHITRQKISVFKRQIGVGQVVHTTNLAELAGITKIIVIESLPLVRVKII